MHVGLLNLSLSIYCIEIEKLAKTIKLLTPFQLWKHETAARVRVRGRVRERERDTERLTTQESKRVNKYSWRVSS